MTIQKAYYRFPVWRFGEILTVGQEAQLDYFQALDSGELFDADGPASRRYIEKRRPALKRIARELGWRCLLDPKRSGKFRAVLGPATALLQRDIRVYYQYIPVVSFPSFGLVNVQSGDRWILGEVITVCGRPAKSKLWLNALLIETSGVPTRSTAVSSDQLTYARSSLERFRERTLSTLREYYGAVVNDIRKDEEKLDLSSEFTAFRTVELAVVVGDAGLRQLFDRVEEEGLSKSLKRYRSSPALAPFADFKSWSYNGSQLRTSAKAEEEPGRPKFVDVHNIAPDFDAIRGFVWPRLFPKMHRLWYGALVEDPFRLDIPPSVNVSRVLAKQIGQSF